MMTITQVTYFLEAAATRSITQASQSLGISQPSLSEQIRRLERELGVALFLRTPRGLRLTEAGERFLPHARRVREGAVAAVAAVAGVRDLEEGSLSFGMFNSGQHVLAGLIPAFRAQHPKISVRLLGANSAQVADEVRAGRLEAGVVVLPVDDRGLTLGDVLWSCEAAYFHLDAQVTARPVSITDLMARPLVLSEVGWGSVDPTRRQLNERAQLQFLQLRPDIEVETGAAALAIAASGVAGAIASVPVAQALGYTRSLNQASLDPPLIETFAIVTRDPASVSPATRAMIDLVSQHMRMLHVELPTGAVSPQD